MQLNTAGIEGINDPGKLLILKREEDTSEWAPLATSRDSSGALISDTLSSFSEFTVGGNAETNPLPVKDKGAMAEKVTLRGNTPTSAPGHHDPLRAAAGRARYAHRLRRAGPSDRNARKREEVSGPSRRHLRRERLPAGVYLYRLRAGSYVETRRMVVVR